MPKLLINKAEIVGSKDYSKYLVQLHMPRTGGTSLTRQFGKVDMIGTLHDGPEKIPEKWKKYDTITTFRHPISWRRSMFTYLTKIGLGEHAYNFIHFTPERAVELDIDPKFGLWEDAGNEFDIFVKAGNLRSWYELYIAYFVAPADHIIPMNQLELHLHKRS